MLIGHSKITQERRIVKFSYTMSVFAISLIVFLSLLNIEHSYEVCAYLSAFILIFLKVPSEFKFSRIDLLITLITLLWVLSPLWSICRTPSVKAAGLAVTLYGFYFLVRSVSSLKDDFYRLINIIALVVVIAEIIAIITFVIHYNESMRLNFNDLYPVRYLFRPFAETNNSWAQISLLCTALCVLSTRFKFLSSYICSIGSLITFSRGAYVVLILMIVVLSLWSKRVQSLRPSIIGIVVGFISISIVFPHEVKTVMSITATESQQRSLEWRKTSSERAMEEFWNHPLLGTGSRSYTMVCNEFNSVESSFSSYPPNLISEVIIEKGLLGIFIYIALLTQILYHLLKFKHDVISAIISSLILLILLKDMTHGILHCSVTVSLLMILLLAIMQSSHIRRENMQCRYSFNNTAVGIITIIITIIPDDLFRNNLENNMILAISSLRRGEYGVAEEIFSMNRQRHKANDPYPLIILASIYLNQNRYNDAKEIIDEVRVHSGYTEFLRGVLCLNESDTAKAIIHLSRSLHIIPALATCIEYKQLDDNVRIDALNKTVNELNCQDANQEAVIGALFYYSGYRHKALSYLESARLEKPTLKIPHKLLGDYNKYHYLCFGAFADPRKERKNQITPKLIDLLLDEYSSRFRFWYSI